MTSFGQTVAAVFGRKTKRKCIVPEGGVGPEIARVIDLIDSGQSHAAFSALNALKSRQVPVRHADYLRAVCFLESGRVSDAGEALKEEIRWFPDHAQARTLLAELDLPASRTSATDLEFQEWFKVIRDYTMVGEARLLSLHTLAKAVCAEDLPGNFVECGVAAGGSSALLAAVIGRHTRRPRKLYSFDTFKGMPDSSAHDQHEGQPAHASGWGAGTCAAPESSLAEVCEKLGVGHLVEPVKGLFHETLPLHRERIGQIALLHMDGDWYSSTRDILEHMYDSVAPGGRIQVDDYGYWEGCKRALAEFEKKRARKFELHRIDETGVWFAK